MIGIPILDNLTEGDLVRVAKGEKIIRIPKPAKLQLSLSPLEEPTIQQYCEYSQSTIITVCKMEIESRLGWIYLKELIDSKEKP